ncbi:hypothetical protein V1525DRAFT_404081 [Lipomyces kononenkoae]|uniref:Uncharacterized protein n=1 Tax=Lipomyces kononenkoae TaxID=34357 RepID=A0ACC3T1E2_LIPKO
MASDDADIEYLANAFNSHLSFKKSQADSSPTSTFASPSSLSSNRRSSSRSPSNMGFPPAGNPFKINKTGLARARKVSLAEFPKQQVFFEFRTWSDESSSEEDEDDDDYFEARKKEKLERNGEKAPRAVLVNTFSSAKSMTTIMSASLNAGESCDSREKEQLRDKIETLTRNLNETKARYDELNNRCKTLAAMIDEGRRENEQLRSRISMYESKIEARPPAGSAGPLTQPKHQAPAMSNTHAPPSQPDGTPKKSNQGVQSKGSPYPASSGGLPTKAVLNPPYTKSGKNLPNLTDPESKKVYERCGVLAYSYMGLKKKPAMVGGAEAINIPNFLEKTIERPNYRFEPNTVTIGCCSKRHDGPTIRSDIFNIFREKASSSPVTNISRNSSVSQKPLCIINCVNDRAARAVFEELCIHPSYRNFILVLS